MLNSLFQTEEAKSLTKTKSAKKKGTGQHPPTIKTIELGCYEVIVFILAENQSFFIFLILKGESYFLDVS